MTQEEKQALCLGTQKELVLVEKLFRVIARNAIRHGQNCGASPEMVTAAKQHYAAVKTQIVALHGALESMAVSAGAQPASNPGPKDDDGD